MTQLIGTKRAPEPTGQQTKHVRLTAKNVDDSGTFEGYGSVFGNEDTYGDVVEPGAFDKSLSAHKTEGTMPALLWQHNPGQPIGVYTEMREDDRGLWVKGQLALETQLGKEAHELLRMGALNGLSIGYRAVEWSYNEDDRVYHLQEIELWEVSLVTFPANTLARVEGVKAHETISDLGNWKSYEAFLRDAGFSHKSAAAMAAAARRIANAEREARQAEADLQAAGANLLEILTN